MKLTIVTSCTNYGQYLPAWARSIVTQTRRPSAVVIVTHGNPQDGLAGQAAVALLTAAGIPVTHEYHEREMDLGAARNQAVALAQTEWVMHLDADDTLFPYALEDCAALAPEADVVAAGYVLAGKVPIGVNRKDRLYKDADGEQILNHSAMCSGISPFRKSFWERAPYRTDMMGAWDTALWIGFARLGARFRATKRAIFQYNQHADSIFSQRRSVLGWKRVRTTAQLKAIRRQYTGVAVIVPRGMKAVPDRETVWARVRSHYLHHHTAWEIVEGKCPTPSWVKGAAIAVALEKTKADILVVADADVMVAPAALQEAVQRVQDGAPWAMPHRTVYRADRAATTALCAQEAAQLPSVPTALARPAYEGAPGGGIFVMRRVWYESIGGIPYAFRGWGSEDRALACLAETLLGPCHRGSAHLVHLYHEPQAYGAQTSSNLQLLRILGAAALRGKDALVSVAYTMPTPHLPGGVPASPWKKNVGTARPIMTAEEVMRPLPPVAVAGRRRVP